MIVLADGEGVDVDVETGDILPGLDALAERPDRRQRLRLELDVDMSAGHVVHDGHVVSELRKMERCGPAAKAIAAEHKNLHGYP